MKDKTRDWDSMKEIRRRDRRWKPSGRDGNGARAAEDRRILLQFLDSGDTYRARATKAEQEVKLWRQTAKDLVELCKEMQAQQVKAIGTINPKEGELVAPHDKYAGRPDHDSAGWQPR